MSRLAGIGLWLLSAAVCAAPETAVQVSDDAGETVRLEAPALRVVSLAPHLAEYVYALDAGSQLVGVSRHTDFPAEAATKPSVGDAHAIDRERLLALQPDLLLVWKGGMAPDRIRDLERLGIAVYQNDIHRLDDVASTLERLAVLLGRASDGLRVARTWRKQLQSLRRSPAHGKPLPAFYQIWHEPLYTVGRGHYLNDFLSACGARNVFSHLPALAPPVSREAVLGSGARLIVLSSEDKTARTTWARFPAFFPVAHQRFCLVDPDHAERPGPRLLLGIAALCRCVHANAP